MRQESWLHRTQKPTRGPAALRSRRRSRLSFLAPRRACGATPPEQENPAAAARAPPTAAGRAPASSQPAAEWAVPRVRARLVPIAPPGKPPGSRKGNAGTARRNVGAPVLRSESLPSPGGQLEEPAREPPTNGYRGASKPAEAGPSVRSLEGGARNAGSGDRRLNFLSGSSGRSS